MPCTKRRLIIPAPLAAFQMGTTPNFERCDFTLEIGKVSPLEFGEGRQKHLLKGPTPASRIQKETAGSEFTWTTWLDAPISVRKVARQPLAELVGSYQPSTFGKDS
jgi:hypothetical protein